jgi:hypothetical protein
MYDGELLNNALTSGDEFANRSLLSIIGSGREKSAEPINSIVKSWKKIGVLKWGLPRVLGIVAIADSTLLSKWGKASANESPRL